MYTSAVAEGQDKSSGSHNQTLYDFPRHMKQMIDTNACDTRVEQKPRLGNRHPASDTERAPENPRHGGARRTQSGVCQDRHQGQPRCGYTIPIIMVIQSLWTKTDR
jgi:hypothetical protein